MVFQKATKKQAKLRLALYGPSGSGKTYTALRIATHLGGRVALIDTEHGSASKYADLFEFDTLELASFYPRRYVEAIRAAEEARYDILIIDSLSHAWAGKDGVLETVDKLGKQGQSGGNFGAWREVTPMQNELIDTIVGAKLHIITTLRSKTEYAMEEDNRGKMHVKKLGLAPIQKDSVEFEFDVACLMDQDNNLIVTKSRCSELSGQVISKPGAEVAKILSQWLGSGTIEKEPEPAAAEPVHQVTPVIACSECGGTISDTSLRTAEEHAELSRERFGSVLCTGCATDKIEAEQKSQIIPPELNKPATRKPEPAETGTSKTKRGTSK